MEDVVILGAGPAGLAAGFELSKNGESVALIDKNGEVGGLSRTSQVKGCRFDLGPHVFIKRNERIVDFWKLIGKGRLSEIQENSKQYYQGKVYGSFGDIFLKLPLSERLAVVADFLKRRLFPISNAVSCEQQMINDYGEKMYSIFQKAYTQKFWGLDLSQIDRNMYNNMIKKISFDALAKKTSLKWLQEKGLIKKPHEAPQGHRFFHHALGSGQMYANLAEMTQKTRNAEFHMNSRVVRVNHDGKKITSIETEDTHGKTRKHEGSQFISTIPLNVFLESLRPAPPKEILEAANKLYFRNLVMVHLVVEGNPFDAQWMQVMSDDITAYRITNFSNLSNHMGSGSLCPVGIEYNCFENDAIWKMSDEEIIDFAKREMEKAGLVEKKRVVDASVLKVDYVYPIYFLGYEKFVSAVADYLSKFENLQCISRSSIYRYNNMGHAVESGLVAADNLLGARQDVKKLNALDGKQDI
ncbi:MAG: FAD-dependent oxidoreductase [Candidatus Norongarragalinales archaeon]